MSLFSPGGPDRSRPADKPVTKITVRLPRAIPAARVVALHAVYGEAVEAGAQVLTLRAGDNRHVVRAPQAGRLLPLAGPGDELRAGDALFALHFDPEPGTDPRAEEAEATMPAPRERGVRSAPRPPPPRRPSGRHVSVLDQDPPTERPARPRRREPGAGEAPEAEPPRPGRTTLHVTPAQKDGTIRSLLRVLAALVLFLAGLGLLLPLIVEAGFGTSVQARLAVMTAALALGFLAWRLLAAGAGGLARAVLAILGTAWATAVLLAMTGLNPLPSGEMVVPESLTPASRVHVPPARPSGVLPGSISAGLGDPAPPGTVPALIPPEQAIAFTALPTERFALGPPLPAVPPVSAGRDAALLAEPGADEAPAAGPAEVPVAVARRAAEAPHLVSDAASDPAAGDPAFVSLLHPQAPQRRALGPASEVEPPAPAIRPERVPARAVALGRETAHPEPGSAPTGVATPAAPPRPGAVAAPGIPETGTATARAVPHESRAAPSPVAGRPVLAALPGRPIRPSGLPQALPERPPGENPAQDDRDPLPEAVDQAHVLPSALPALLDAFAVRKSAE